MGAIRPARDGMGHSQPHSVQNSFRQGAATKTQRLGAQEGSRSNLNRERRDTQESEKPSEKEASRKETQTNLPPKKAGERLNLH